MSSYPLVQLGDLADVVAGDPAPQDPQAFASKGPLFVRMQDVGRHHLHPALSNSTDRLSREWLAQNRLRRFPKDSILIPKSGASVNLNHRAKLGTEAYVVSHLAVVIPDRSKIEPDYLYWWSVSYDPRAQTQVTSLPSLKLSTLKAATIPLPPLEEQRRIVGILNRAAKIERLRQQAACRLREFIPALFIKMFGDPVENPMGWDHALLGDLSEVQGGLQVTKKRSMHPLETPYLRVANVLRDRLDLNEIKTMRITEKEFERVRLRHGDLLIVEGHGNASEIGRVAMWDGRIGGCVHQNHLIRVRPDRSVILPEFACAYLNSSSGRQHLLRSGKTTSGLNTISTSNVKSCVILVPPIDQQRRYGDICEAMKSATKDTQFASRTAASLAASLLSCLLESIRIPRRVTKSALP